MANYQASRTKTAQLVANTVDTVVLTDYFETVEVVNLSGTAEIWLLADGDISPTVGGDDCNVIPAATAASLAVVTIADATSTVRLISSGTPRYHVRGISERGSVG